MSVWPRPEPLFHLQLYGAGHVGRAIARVLATLDVQVDWIDEREEEFPFTLFDHSPWPEHIRTLCVDAVESEVRYAPHGAYYLVLTHNHDLDMRITEAVLQRGDFGYLGLIGSETKRQRFLHRFEQRGIAPERLARMVCPIGVAGIDGKQPEVIAVAVVAQLLQADGIPALNEEVRPDESASIVAARLGMAHNAARSPSPAPASASSTPASSAPVEVSHEVARKSIASPSGTAVHASTHASAHAPADKPSAVPTR